MLQLNTTVTFSLRVPLGLGSTVMDTIRLRNVRLEMVALNKKKNNKQRNKNKQQSKPNSLSGREIRIGDLCTGWGGHRPAPFNKNIETSILTIKGFSVLKLVEVIIPNSSYMYVMRKIVEYLSVSEELNYN